MEERSNKTIMCSVLFLDIAEYSKRSVAGQISLKDRFNSYLSAAISGVPITDRIILDTGDGAAINFLGDVEDALKAALSLRESMLNEDPDIDPPLLVRVGINLGPVRLVRDINGQPNIVGDGINVAQRVMDFADAGQILVSRSYYDAVSRLSPQYAEIFHYQGSRTDKHVREHEVYAIGYPGDKTILPVASKNPTAGLETGLSAQILARTKAAWDGAAAKLGNASDSVMTRFKQAEPTQKALYLAAVGIPLLLFIGLAVKLIHRNETAINPIIAGIQVASGVQSASAVHEALPIAVVEVVSGVQSASAVHKVFPVSAPVESKETAAAKPPPAKLKTVLKPNAKMVDENKSIKDKATHQEAKPEARSQDTTEKSPEKSSEKSTEKSSEKSSEKSTEKPTEKSSPGLFNGGGEHVASAYVSVTCTSEALLYIDGANKGKIIGTLKVAVPPGQHLIIVTHSVKGLFSQKIESASGATAHIRPGFCS